MQTSPLTTCRNANLSLWQSVVSQALLEHLEYDTDQKLKLAQIQDHPVMRDLNRHVELVRLGKVDPGNISQAIFNGIATAIRALPEMTEGDRNALALFVLHENNLLLGKHKAAGTAAETRPFSDADWENFVVKCISDYKQYSDKHKGVIMYNSCADSNGSIDPRIGELKYRLPNDAKVAIIGDWGTGMDDASMLLETILATHNPDALIHLGDIYYSGTKDECERHFAGVLRAAFDKHGRRIPVFTIPGNHDYYAFGYDYYEMVAKLNPDDNMRQTTSYFCLKTEDDGWQLLGMDTGYKDGAPTDQINPVLEAPGLHCHEECWHKAHLDSFAGGTILLSHHQLFSASSRLNGRLSAHASTPHVNQSLLKIFQPYFGTKVGAWFWGHEHNQIIFKDNLWGLPKGRLIGASAYEEATSSDPYHKSPCVPFQNYEVSASNGYYNHGYVVLDFGARNGTPTGKVHATYYEYPSWGATVPDPVPNAPTLFFEEDIVLQTPVTVAPDPTCNTGFLQDLADSALSNSLLQNLISEFGFDYDAAQGILYSKRDAWQRKMGYFELYDIAAPFSFMFIDCEPIRFEYPAGKHWNIEFWKGQYGMCTGAEVGIYTGTFHTGIQGIDHAIAGLRPGDDTQVAPQDDWLEMRFELQRHTDVLFTRTSDDNPPAVGKHWWLTGFKPGVVSAPSELLNKITIVCKDEAMGTAFVQALQKVGYTEGTEEGQYTASGATVTILFGKPYTEQPMSWLPDAIVRKAEDVINYLKKAFDSTVAQGDAQAVADFIGRNYQDVAVSVPVVLQQIGYQIAAIATYLNSIAGSTAASVARELNELGYSAKEVLPCLQALQNTFQQTLDALRQAGYSTADITELINGSWRPDSIAELYAALHQLGVGLVKAVQIINGAGFSKDAIVDWLEHSKPAASLKDIAEALLWLVGSKTKVARILWEYFNATKDDLEELNDK